MGRYVERSGCRQILVTIQVFVWRDCGKPKTTPVRIRGLRYSVRNRDLAKIETGELTVREKSMFELQR